MPNSFYTLEQYIVENGHIMAVIRFQPADAIFAGHFPGQPVVPGVCMVQIVMALVMQALGRKDLFLSQGHQLKFLQPIVPDINDLIEVTIALRAEEGGYPVQAAFKKDNVALFKMTGVFSARTF